MLAGLARDGHGITGRRIGIWLLDSLAAGLPGLILGCFGVVSPESTAKPSPAPLALLGGERSGSWRGIGWLAALLALDGLLDPRGM